MKSMDIYAATVAAMQPAEEISGPQGADYVSLMARIANDAIGRMQSYASLELTKAAEARGDAKPSRHEILKNVRAELRRAEHEDGPAGWEYDHLMLQIMKLAETRLAANRAARGLRMATATPFKSGLGTWKYRMEDGDFRGQVFLAEDVPSPEDAGREVIVLYCTPTGYARQAPTTDDVEV